MKNKEEGKETDEEDADLKDENDSIMTQESAVKSGDEEELEERRVCCCSYSSSSASCSCVVS